MNKKSIVLGLCTANRCRSQMFEAILRNLAGAKVIAVSAGTKATFVHPLAVKVLKEIGVSVENQVSKSIHKLDFEKDELFLKDQNGNLHSYQLSDITHVITLCGGANETCPVFPGKVVREHWDIDDPDQHSGTEEEVLPYFRASRDDILSRLRKFVSSYE